MTGTSFNRKYFIRTVSIFLTLTISWTTLCIVLDEFTNKDKGLITGLGYLLLLSISIYFGQGLKRFVLFCYLAIITIVTFLVGSFVLGPLIGLASDSMVLYSIVNSIFVSIVMTVFVSKIVRIEFKVQTILLTCLLLLIAYFIIYRFSDKLFLEYNFHPRLTMFNIFQFALLLPLTIGMTIRKNSIQ